MHVSCYVYIYIFTSSLELYYLIQFTTLLSHSYHMHHIIVVVITELLHIFHMILIVCSY